MTAPSVGRKRLRLDSREFTLFLAATMALTALGVDVMLPAFSAIREGFGLAPDSTEVARVVTAYFLGIASGQVFYGPIADYFGGKKTLLFAGSLYAVGAIASAFAPSLGLLLFARFVWGLGAAGGRVIVGAVVRDVYSGDRMARAMSMVFSIFILVPVFAPALGALLLAVASWEWIFGFCASVGPKRARPRNEPRVRSDAYVRKLASVRGCIQPNG